MHKRKSCISALLISMMSQFAVAHAAALCDNIEGESSRDLQYYQNFTPDNESYSVEVCRSNFGPGLNERQIVFRDQEGNAVLSMNFVDDFISGFFFGEDRSNIYTIWIGGTSFIVRVFSIENKAWSLGFEINSYLPPTIRIDNNHVMIDIYPDRRNNKKNTYSVTSDFRRVR